MVGLYVNIPFSLELVINLTTKPVGFIVCLWLYISGTFVFVYIGTVDLVLHGVKQPSTTRVEPKQVGDWSPPRLPPNTCH